MADKTETMDEQLHRMRRDWTMLSRRSPGALDATLLDLVGDVLIVLRQMRAEMNTAAAGERQRITRVLTELFQGLAEKPAPKPVLTEIGTLIAVRCPMCGEAPAYHLILGSVGPSLVPLSAGVFCNHCNSHWMGAPDTLSVLKRMRLFIADPPPEE